MSVSAMARVWELGGLTATEKIVLLSLADHAGEDCTCYPSVRRLIERTGLAERAIQGAVKRLKAVGLVSVEAQGGKGGANLFRLHLMGEDDVAPRTKCTPARNAPPHVVRQTPAPNAPKPSGTVIKSSVPIGTGTDAPISKMVFDAGVALLVRANVPERQARSFLGKLRQAYPDGEVFAAIADCDRAGAVEPVAWLTKRLQPRPPPVDVRDLMRMAFTEKPQ